MFIARRDIDLEVIAFCLDPKCQLVYIYPISTIRKLSFMSSTCSNVFRLKPCTDFISFHVSFGEQQVETIQDQGRYASTTFLDRRKFFRISGLALSILCRRCRTMLPTHLPIIMVLTWALGMFSIPIFSRFKVTNNVYSSQFSSHNRAAQFLAQFAQLVHLGISNRILRF